MTGQPRSPFPTARSQRTLRTRSLWPCILILVTLLTVFQTSPSPAKASTPTITGNSFKVILPSGPAGTHVLASSIVPCATPAGRQITVNLTVTDPLGGDARYRTLADQGGSWSYGQIPVRTADVPLGKYGYNQPGSYILNATCSYDDSTSSHQVIVTTYDAVTFVATKGLRFTSSPASPAPNGRITLARIDPCPAPATSVVGNLYYFDKTGYQEVAQTSAVTDSGGAWGPMALTVLAASPQSFYLDVTCYSGIIPTLDYDAVLITVSVPSQPVISYVALGDSYSSGEGNAPPPFDGGTATPADQCHRSPHAWPRILAAQSGIAIRHLACSGATLNDVTAGKYGEPGQVAALAKLNATKVVTLVTVTIGGNDVGFKTILGSCRFYPRCLTNLPSNLATVDLVASQLRFNLLPAIQKAAPAAKIVVVGYPRLFPASKYSNVNCGWLTETKRIALNTLDGHMDSTYKAQVGKFGATYVSTYDSLAGHELCTRNSWVNPITSASTNWLTNANQGHPTYNGQLAMAETVKSALGL